MDFGTLPPEVNSARMYSGPGPGTLLAASAQWEELAVEMHVAAARCESVIAELISGSWIGPSSRAMTAAVLPYTGWVRSTAAHCEDVATKASAAANAYETAYAMTVPPPLIAANRARLAALIAGNLVGQNTPAIMVAEAEYSEMWAQDAAAMYGYAANSVSASAVSAFAPPARASGSGAPGSTAQGASATLLNSTATTLQGLASPGSGATAALAAGAPATSSAVSTLTALSRLAKTSGQSVSRSTSAGMQAASQLATAMASLVDVGNSAAPELGTSALGFGSDGFGLSTDISGFALDLAGSGLELVGGDSLLGAEEAVPGELGAIGPLDELSRLADPWSAGLGGEPSAGLGQASQLGTLSVPPGWVNALSGNPASPPTHATSPPGHHGSAAGTAHRHSAKLPMGGMVGQASGGAAHRVGVPASLIPRSPVGG
jgi:PPE-repeat protein